jgi:hypothetical protein
LKQQGSTGGKPVEDKRLTGPLTDPSGKYSSISLPINDLTTTRIVGYTIVLLQFL